MQHATHKEEDLLETKFIWELRRALRTTGIEVWPSLACHCWREQLNATLGGVES